MTIFISHAAADAETAQELEKFLERRGQFVELDDGETALRPLQAADVAILLISQHLVMSPWRLRLEQRALDAWADGRLILVKLDHAFAPVGLRDLPATDASFEAQREFKWNEIAQAAQNLKNAPWFSVGPSDPLSREAAEAEKEVRAEQVEAWEKKTRAKGKASFIRGLLAFVLCIPGAVALAAIGSIWLVNRIGPTPGGFTQLRAGLDALAERYGAPSGIGAWAAFAAVALMLIVLVSAIASLFKKPARAEPASNAPLNSIDPPITPSAIFVSYARANSGVVLPVLEAAKRAGRKFWLDQQSTKAGDGWAGEIVRAIRGAPEVLVMCSQAAFESDHVKREIYLADRYKKRLVPVFVEAAQPPEDFEYFFAGVQWLNLFETPEADRPAALMRILEAA